MVGADMSEMLDTIAAQLEVIEIERFSHDGVHAEASEAVAEGIRFDPN